MSGINRRKAAIIVAIAVLVALNVWRWWPRQHGAANNFAAFSAGFRTEDFEVKALPADAKTPMARDIFHPRRITVAKPVTKPAPAIALVPPPKPPEVLARENAQTEFAQMRCVGISVRDKRIQAYLITGGEPALVSAGDKAGSRFIVEKIVPEGVVVKDPETGVGGQIAVSGK